MGYLSPFNGPDLICCQGHNPDSFSIEGREFNFVTFALFVYEDYSADVAGRQSVFRRMFSGESGMFAPNIFDESNVGPMAGRNHTPSPGRIRPASLRSD
jgi:hypothetical protein